MRSNFIPDNTTMPLAKFVKIQQQDEQDLEDNRDYVRSVHFRFLGKLKNRAEIDSDDYFDVITLGATLDKPLPYMTEALKLVWNPGLTIYASNPARLAYYLAKYANDDDTNYLSEHDVDDIYNNVNHYANAYDIDIHTLDSYFAYLYDLNDDFDVDQLY